MPYLVTEFIEGQTLHDWRTDKASIGLDAAHDLLVALLEILQDMHDEAANLTGEVLVHCDLTPHNIRITPGTRPRITIIDFGISQKAKMLKSQVTSLGTPAGQTADYRVPELSTSDPPTARSDVFQVGLIAFELLTRQKYWRTLASERQELLQHQVPNAQLIEAVWRALKWNPQDRWPSAKAFKSNTKVVRKATVQYRHAITDLKRQVAELTKRLNLIEKPPPKEITPPSEVLEKARFRAIGVKVHRAKLGLSAMDYGKLAGVSAQAIFFLGERAAAAPPSSEDQVAGNPGLGHLDHIIQNYVQYHNELRPHQSKDNAPPPAVCWPAATGSNGKPG